MATYAWTDEHLDACRQIGAAEVDPLAMEILSGQSFDQQSGRLGYHRLLDLADRLIEAPELYLVEGSQVRRDLDAMPPQFTGFLDPLPVPDWVDAARLERASELWEENMLAIIGVLYAASLPSCYLIAKGIPTLYETGKLGQHRYIYQRIYETGLMLDGVMERGGLHLITDVPPSPAQPGQTPEKPQRYVWGRGFLAARKVRLLHASMRAMLLRPELVAGARGSRAFAASSAGALSDPAKPYDRSLGVPVNQEDLAYTLMTFGQIIPAGLARWGCRLSTYDCECFLHAWRLVGHLMGVRDELLPRDWPAAGDLVATVKRRQAARCAMGPKLTRSLELFLCDYLPSRLRPTVPALLIRSQLGKDADLILPADTPRPGPVLRTLYALTMFLLGVYYWTKRLILSRMPLIAEVVGGAFSTAGDALVDSWRDGYDRRPFWIPDSVTGWRPVQGVTHDFKQELRDWRGRLFSTVIWGTALVVAGTLSLLAAPLLLLVNLTATWVAATVAAAIWLAGIIVLRVMVAKMVRDRPLPTARTTVGPTALSL